MARAPALSEEQRRAFARDGFIVVPRLLDPEETERSIAFCWERYPAHFKRNDPATWRGDVRDSCLTLGLHGRAGLVKFQTADLKGFVDTKKLLNPALVEAIARQLIAPGVKLDPPSTRGLYSVFPIPRRVSVPTRGHLETHPMQIGSISYLNDVREGEGAFSVWPGSHRLFYSAFSSKVGYVATPEHDAIAARLNQCHPVQIPAGKGDVIFFHYRLFHSPSNNNGQTIRQAFLCDFKTDAHVARSHEAPGALWEDWPLMQQVDDGADTLDAVCARLNSSALRRLWVTSPWARRLVLGPMATNAAKARAQLSREARAQTSLEDWIRVRTGHARDHAAHHTPLEIHPRAQE